MASELNNSFIANNHTALVSTFLLSTTPPLWMRLVAVILGVPVFFVGGFLNFTTLAAFARDLFRQRRQLWQRHYINIAGLALADAVLCIYTCSQFVAKYASGYWLFSSFYCHIFWAISTWAYVCSLLMLVLVANDRYQIIRHGARYNVVETWRVAIPRTILYGLLQPVMSLPLFFMNYWTGVSVNRSSEECFPEAFQIGYWFPLLSAAGFLLVVIHMGSYYVRVYLYMKKQRVHQTENEMKINNNNSSPMNVTPATASTATASVQNNATTGTQTTKLGSLSRKSIFFAAEKLVVVLAVRRRRQQKRPLGGRILKYLFVSLTVCDLPYFVIAAFTAVAMSGKYDMDAEWWIQFYDLAQVFGWLNNAINPLLYAYTMPSLHDAMFGVWKEFGVWFMGSVLRIKSVKDGKTWPGETKGAAKIT